MLHMCKYKFHEITNPRFTHKYSSLRTNQTWIHSLYGNTNRKNRNLDGIFYHDLFVFNQNRPSLLKM